MRKRVRAVDSSVTAVRMCDAAQARERVSQGIETADFSRGGPVMALKTRRLVRVPGADSSFSMASRSEEVVELLEHEMDVSNGLLG